MLPNEWRCRINMVDMPINVNSKSGTATNQDPDSMDIDMRWTMMTLRSAVAWTLMRSRTTEA